ncbi:MAG: hypothetical protein IME94_02395 [Proteobacteria bacterium]|nr:hypothetical protein [Pseudomonadota bacterium]
MENFLKSSNELKGFIKVSLVISAVMILCNYYYFYFFKFNEGVVEGVSAWFHLIKIVALCLLYSLVLTPRVKDKFNFNEYLLFISFFCFFCVFCIKEWYWDVEDMKFINFLVCSIPMLFLQMNKERARVFFFLDICLIIVATQIIFEQAIYSLGFSLWDNKAFVGGLGNPSGFGLLCAVFIVYSLFFKQASLLMLGVVLILLYGLVMTSSMMVVILITVVLFLSWGYFLRNKEYGNLIISIITIISLFVTYEYIASDHLLYKINSLLRMIGLSSAEVFEGSRSVSVRYQIHQEFFSHLINDFYQVMTYGYSNVVYYKVDSQYLTYFSSFGVIGGGFFFMAIFLVAISSCNKWRDGTGMFVIITIYLLMFFTNRILDYYPLALFLFIIIMLAQDNNKSGSIIRT